MTWPVFADRDATQIDALIADRYLEALLAAGERRADDVPADVALDPELRAAARALRRAFVRVHPSFRFEERLAGRLAELAASQRAGAAPLRAGAAPLRAGTLVPYAAPPARLTALDPDLPAIIAGALDPADAAATRPGRAGDHHRAPYGAVPRPVILGGAVASAAISLAGVAIVAWRAARPPRHATGPMARAARAAHGRRLATAGARPGRTA